jgi:tetratricopeptide (TPR) repeat protein
MSPDARRLPLAGEPRPQTMLGKVLLLLLLFFQPQTELGSLLARGDSSLSAGDLVAAEQTFLSALDFLERELALTPEEPLLHVDRALVLKRMGRLEEAEAGLSQAIALRPEDATSHHLLGELYPQQGRLEAAREAFERSLSIDPAYAPSWLLMESPPLVADLGWPPRSTSDDCSERYSRGEVNSDGGARRRRVAHNPRRNCLASRGLL